MSTRERVQEWIRWTDTTVQQIHDVAGAAPLGGDEHWGQLMAKLDVESLPPDERIQMLSGGAPTARGPVPIEVRRALESVAKKALDATRQLDHELDLDDEETQQTLDRFQHRLSDLVDKELARYLQGVRPRATTASIFATAAASTQGYMSQTEGAGVKTHTCPTCGAPRGGDEPSPTCSYCGSKIL